MSSEDARPRLRTHLEAIPVQIPELEQEGPLFLIRDPLRLGKGHSVLPAAGLELASLFDGARTLRDAQHEFLRRHGVLVPLEQVEGLVRSLEDAMLLDGPAFRAEVDRFLKADVRPPACIGSYPGDPGELLAFLDGQYRREGGPGGPPSDAPAGAGAVRAIVSPHIDMHRGGHAYAWTWRAVAEACQAEVFVVFGTSHAGTGPIGGGDASAPRFALTRKPFLTPLGRVDTDVDVVDRLLASYRGGDDLLAGEYHHRGEHSIEFQAVYLSYLFRARRPVRIVPILCGSIHDLGGPPSADAGLLAFQAALREALAPIPPEKVAFVAGIDLAHVGAMFHEPPVSEADLLPVATADRRTLELALAARDPDAVHADIVQDGDKRNICGHSALVAMLQALDGAPVRGELLCYNRWHDGASSVSFAGAVYRDDRGA